MAAVTARLGQQYPATNEFKAGAAESYDSLGTLERSACTTSRLGMMMAGAGDPGTS